MQITATIHMALRLMRRNWPTPTKGSFSNWHRTLGVLIHLILMLIVSAITDWKITAPSPF
ncbi:uncharacterized protein BJ212DRAFT_150001 [Suillus subaureus]|uniref:Uncharacterized protein n=1 Tax=Suillus subaureus TaxID=48587 RepID=A0A9P7EC33_9AGAM|nr:uncharacterized protein BJ212DRAFT_150001 [Suillus subaureus]KAG1817080.1 hypothetical protein BJ212DRAFT_150001 [Suillus subaureus]